MKKSKIFDPFKNLVLDKYEQEIEDSLERDKYVPVKKDIDKLLDEAAKYHPEIEDSKSITLRVKNRELIKLKAKASRNNIPYQTLINLLINSYTDGKIKLSL